MNGSDKPKPLSLFDAGFDVWFGHTRGRLYSKGHDTWVADDALLRGDYWQYSFEEIGTEDLPAMIDQIIATRPVNGCQKV